MAAARKTAPKRKITARDVEVGNRTLEAVLIDVAERSKQIEERSARAEERSARAEEMAADALRTIGSVLRDLHALAQRTETRLAALEKPAAE